MPVAPSSSFPIPVAVNLEYRPDTYLADWCVPAALVQNVTGEARRAELFRACTGGARVQGGTLIDEPPRPLPARLLADRLPPAERARYVAGDPLARVSGEYLPPYLPGELEIARVVLDLRPQLVYSMRARIALPLGVSPHTGPPTHATWAEMRFLRVVSERPEHKFRTCKGAEFGTLTLADLIRGLDSVRASHLSAFPEHLPFPEALVLEASQLGVPAGALHDAVHVSSAVYPELRPFYRQRLAWWVQQHFTVGPRARYRRETWADTLARWWGARG
jgi:hypothetical protein